MDRYRVRKSLGQGSFGRVVEAVDLDDKSKDNLVAIKQIGEIWDDLDCLKKVLRELRILRNVCHPHILKLRKSILDEDKQELFIVTDICVSDLHKFIQDTRKYTELSSNWVNIYKMIHQILSAVKYLHDRSIMHRDIKPANILLDRSYNIKLCDFGLARLVHIDETISESNNNNPLTDSNIDQMNEISIENTKLTEYVVTRWYRAPEVSLCNGKYSLAQDIWSCACTFAELLTRRPLFPGRSYIHQIKVIISVLGVNLSRDIDFEMDPNGRKLVHQFLDQAKSNNGLREKIKPSFHIYNIVVWEYTLQLLSSMLSFNPHERITASEALCCPLFAPFGERRMDDLLPMIPFLYMNDIEQNNENIVMLRQLLQTEVAKTSLRQSVTPRNSNKHHKKRHLTSTSLSSVSPYTSNRHLEELKDECVKSDLDDRHDFDKSIENISHSVELTPMVVDSKDIHLKPQTSLSSSSPFTTIRTQLSRLLPNWLVAKNDIKSDEDDRITTLEKKKLTPKSFCCLTKSVSCFSP